MHNRPPLDRRPYYLEPDNGAKAYALRREALAKSGKVGVAQFVLRNRESLCVLKAQSNALTLNTLRFASEIRSADELRLPINEKLVPNEVNLSLKLIEGMTAEFDPAKYRDTYTEDVKKLIEEGASLTKKYIFNCNRASEVIKPPKLVILRSY